MFNGGRRGLMDRALSWRPGGPGLNPVYSSFSAEDFQISKVGMKDRNGRSVMKKIKDCGLEDGLTRTKTKVELGI